MNLLIIGCGLAGLSAAVSAAENGDQVTVLSSSGPERASSVLAAGGINAALNTKGEDDSPEQHFLDTMKAGCDLADPEAVRGLTMNAPALIRELSDRGIVFSRDENGDPDLRYFGGQKKKRTVFSKSAIGKQLVAGLSSVLYRHIAEGRIRLITEHRFLRAAVSGGCYDGAILTENLISGELETINSDALLIATGGMGGLFGNTTASAQSDGSAAASLFLSGLQFANLEMIQYHPTTIQTAQKRMLISEAARGEGGRLFTIRDGKRWYFMEDWYGEKGNLMPRDIVSQCIYNVCVPMKLGLNGRKEVGLDLTHLEASVISDRLKEVADTCQLYLNLDPAKDIIPVYPGVHYFMGGIRTDRFHRTSVHGIYAAGECACIYHGANRLGGNSTLGAVYGGRLASRTAAADASSGRKKPSDLFPWFFSRTDAGENPAVILQDLQIIMNLYLGIVRTPEDLQEGIRLVRELQSRTPAVRRGHLFEAQEAHALPLLAEAMLQSALERRESRGAQMRSDYPERDDEHFRKDMVALRRDDQTEITADEIGRLFND